MLTFIYAFNEFGGPSKFGDQGPKSGPLKICEGFWLKGSNGPRKLFLILTPAGELLTTICHAPINKFPFLHRVAILHLLTSIFAHLCYCIVNYIWSCIIAHKYIPAACRRSCTRRRALNNANKCKQRPKLWSDIFHFVEISLES